jgi:hypothetical protein
MNNLKSLAGALSRHSIFVFLRGLADALKMRARRGYFRGLRDAAPGEMTRRRAESNPNIVCGFPIFQKAREEAPFF